MIVDVRHIIYMYRIILYSHYAKSKIHTARWLFMMTNYTKLLWSSLWLYHISKKHTTYTHAGRTSIRATLCPCHYHGGGIKRKHKPCSIWDQRHIMACLMRRTCFTLKCIQKLNTSFPLTTILVNPYMD